MKIQVTSIFDIFEYVMDHYYPAGLEEFAVRTDTYAVISIQDTQTEGFGITFTENQFCKGVLTLHFDDVYKEVEGAVAFDRNMARKIIDFIEGLEDVDTLAIHCYAGQSRSWAVGAFAEKMLGEDNSGYFQGHSPNLLVYNTLLEEWKNK